MFGPSSRYGAFFGVRIAMLALAWGSTAARRITLAASDAGRKREGRVERRVAHVLMQRGARSRARRVETDSQRAKSPDELAQEWVGECVNIIVHHLDDLSFRQNRQVRPDLL
jgi:hypothetical protein